jgi:SAM-dependent methyltransferase
MFLFSASGLRHYVEILKTKKKVSKLSDTTDNAIHINYNPNPESDLAKLCDEYGTDKGELIPDSNPYPWPSHNYSDFYELIFSSRRNSVESLLECGIGTPNTEFTNNMGEEGNPGASLRVWRDYFPNAEVTGIDIDPEVMFSEDRINTYCVDQTSEESIKDFLDKYNGDFDIIIDDGLHEYQANVSLFENTIGRLSEDGLYIIEDVSYNDLEKYQEYFIDGLEQYHTKFIDLENPNRPYRKSDRLIIISSV